MKILSITWKDIQIFMKDRGALLTLFVLPLMFVLVFSGALSEIGSQGEKDTRIPLAVVDLDGSQTAQAFIKDVDTAGGVRVEMYDESEVMPLVQENEIPRALIIPAGFAANVDAGQPTTLRLVTHPEADGKQTEAVRLVIEGVAADATLQIQMLAALQQMSEMQAAAPGADMAFSVDRMQAQARSQFDQAQTQPLVHVEQKVPGQEEAVDEDEPLGIGDIAVPGVTVLFVFWTAQTTASTIYDEKKIGSFRRLLAAPVSKTSLLLGKLVPNFLIALVQSAVIFAFGIWGLDLMGMTPATLGNAPLATVLILVLLALCSSSFGILLAALARTEAQVGGLSMIIVWLMAVLGGSLIPLFLLEQFLGPVPMIVPHYWANRALVDLMVRGAGFADVIVEMVALLGFSALFFAVGAWRFEFN
ncbi:MAG: ABC transporter permease [Anaerolineae bacterium]|jgi:ABC-2 type transport system permease protein